MPRESRSRSRSRSRGHRKRRSRSKSQRRSTRRTLDAILTRLSSLESSTADGSSRNVPVSPIDVGTTAHLTPEQNLDSSRVLADLLSTISGSKPQHYYVSNFDPKIHDVDAWCEEVDRAQIANKWSDKECLARVAGCLKGDANQWLNEWVTSDRSWSSFKTEFKPLCPRKLDYANILFDTMCANSDKFSSYAEYARRTLLRLRIVKGLSEELMIQIVIRGICNPQVRAAAANADLTCESIVSFLSIYVRPGPNTKRDSDNTRIDSNSRYSAKKRHLGKSVLTCFNCSQPGHKSLHCPKKSKMPDNNATPSTSTSGSGPVRCTFCLKPGHREDKCFAKERSESRNVKKVNLCREYEGEQKSNDITTAIVQGIPVDVLIDSGALNVSLISEDTLRYLSCSKRPTMCVIKGISEKPITVNSLVTLVIEFKEISIEVDLLVVPSSCMTAPIIIGTDVLNREGVVYIRTKERQYLTRSSGVANVASVSTDTQQQINTPLKDYERDLLLAVINDFSAFLITGTATSTVKTGEMHINLTDDTPIAYHPYRLSYDEKLRVREIIRDLLDKGIIRESQSPYSSPILLVKKKDGADRMCVDFRALNKITVKDRYPLPLIDDHIDRLGSCKFFTSLDMATGFHQIIIAEGSVHKTGFVTPEGHYEYLKMPYGLTNSPTVYQRIINNTLRRFIDSGDILVYIDDVLLLSMTVQDGIALLREVLQVLTDAGFSINLRKCTFLTTEIEYLGRVISQGQVKPSPRKVEALVNSPVPCNVKQVRQLLGLAGYFRRYIQDYAAKTACIAHLTKSGVKFEWGSEQEQARQYLISCLTNQPILSIFDHKLPTELHTDASSIGYGAVLMQTQPDGKKTVVEYFSKTTQGAKSRYHSYELETLAVVKALQHFRHYLVGIEFKIVTDCNALKSTENKKDLLPRVARWWIYLQDFTFNIEYRKGTSMTHADYLSRNPPAVQVHSIEKPRNWAQMAQAGDEEVQDLVQKLNEGSLDARRYVKQNDILYYRYTPTGEEPRLLCYVPKGHRLSLLRLFHDEHTHIGIDKTVDLILKHFWFPGLNSFVRKYISHCLICISRKRVPRAPHQPITSFEKPNVPFETLHVDVLGPLPESEGFKFVLVLVDSFSKYCLLYALYKQDVSELKRVMTNAVSLFGSPKLLVADRGRMFESCEFTKWTNDLGCEVHLITPEMHQANGQAERYIRTVLNMIRIESRNNKSSWSQNLWRLQLVINITKQKTTQRSPLNLLIGTDATTPVIRALIRDVAVEGSQPNRFQGKPAKTFTADL
ncbi:unnamed protein product [Plutella xylostella]|uniref:RNA-directed DNA polymerase n=1 Tax=Plutella xylostella TaxID=51655 RepID=A0A8S4F7Z8_PLUXY|nr:unnamed protein product [Plutella xylostella]